jgi:aspartyl protease family protein
MNADQIASLLYLGLLLAAVGGWFFVRNRHQLGNLTQMAALWGLIFLGVIAAAGLWEDIRRTTLPSQSIAADGRIELPRAPDGHFYAILSLNDASIRFMVDTGATQVVLTAADARRVGLDPEKLVFLGRADTANGPIKTAFARVNTVSLGPYTDQNLGVSVTQADLGVSLLGMSYLQRFNRVEISQDRMILSR